MVNKSSDLGQTIDSNCFDSANGEFSLSDMSFLAPSLTQEERGWLAHYRVLKVLGQGGMGAVLLAEDTRLQRRVALKVILPEFAAKSGARERFIREARACAALRNEHVITIFDVGQDRDVPYLAMEFLEGQTLDKLLVPDKLLPLREVVRIGREIADGLAAAHACGLIHRDIKPANIWIEAPSGKVKLLDFGLARPVGSRSDLTQTGRIVGTPEFMSPEQARGEELDPRSDLFSLGAVLYAIATGVKPFQGDSVMAVLTALAVDKPPHLYERRPDAPPVLADLVSRLLAKNRADRPASAREVCELLTAIEFSLIQSAGGDTLTGMKTSSMPRVPCVTVITPSARSNSRPTRKIWRRAILAGAILAAVAGMMALWFNYRPTNQAGVQPSTPTGTPIRVGVLHSRTGTMAVSERPVIDATLLAVDEINAAGGLLGRPVEAVVADGQSEEAVFARQAEKLIRDDNVCVLFGCWTSSSRKAVVPVVERLNNLLFYPVQYEGMEQSPNVVYCGPVPNQQILPALHWLVGFKGKRRWFLVGSNYVFPVTANAIIRDEARVCGCEIVGEEYLPLGSTDVAGVVKRIAETKPDLIVNTINGDTNVAFFRALRRAGITSRTIPTLSFSISDEELNTLGPTDTSGNYVAGNYFDTIDTPQNKDFLQRFSRRYGDGRPVSSAMESAYTAVHLWVKAVQAASSFETQSIREAIKGQQSDSPGGVVHIDPETRHTVQTARIGKVSNSGRLEEVYFSPQPIMPEPFPSSRTREEWQTFLDSLYKRWGGRWSQSQVPS